MQLRTGYIVLNIDIYLYIYFVFRDRYIENRYNLWQKYQPIKFILAAVKWLLQLFVLSCIFILNW